MGTSPAPGTLDAITTNADFLGAVRLPSGTFHADGTDVVADILFLRKHDLTPDPSITAWNDRAEREPEGTDHGGLNYRTRPASRRLRIMAPDATSARDSVTVNRYWEVHPTHVAGTMTATGSMRYAALMRRLPATSPRM